MKSNTFLSQLGNYFEVYLPDVRKASPNTISSYGDSFAILFEFFNEEKNISHTKVTFKMFTPALTDEFMLWMTNTRHYSASSVRNRMTALSSFLKYASQRNMTAVKPYTSIIAAERPSGPQDEFSYFTVDELKNILSLPNPRKYLGKRDLVFLSTLYETASRAQEICDLRIGDIRFGETTKIKLHGKGNKQREIPVSSDVASLLKYYMKEQGLSAKDRDCYVFLNQRGQQMTPACVRSIVKKYVNLAKKNYPDLFNEPSYSPHSFRHSKAVHMVEAGIDLIYIRNFLGHEHISTTEIYAKVSQEAVTKALTNRKIPKISASTPSEQVKNQQLPDCIKNARKTKG